ncbi:hypothetical protein DYU05_20155 [Mucilaginibacter terrenus]|uniref:DUF4440 domain-containing protein n=1 Tax=Mucilaginibacter terrenus TaxID=2482727 RepID=A0A3E2NJB6_9SPHI|nr:hypothetical protein [Mucilaginibacter terrenus]RFZ81075.1 hypothetical protein DYU05_20155 [Mucilaginibacter terrenus]
MKLKFSILLLLLLPATLYAQDTTVVKKQAAVVAKAVLDGNYGTVIDYMYPKVVQMSGGKAKLLQMMTKGMSQMKAQGVSFSDASVGSPGKFYKAGTEIHCLVPEYITMKAGASTIRTKSNLLAITKITAKPGPFLTSTRTL